jgi:uncharacterized protein
MSDNTDVVRKAYDDFNSGNVDGVLEFWADDIRWEGSNDERLPGGGTYDGKEDAAQVLSNIPEHYEGFTSPGDEFLEDGDNVVVLGHAEGTAKGTRKSFKVPFVHVWRREAGKAKRAQLLTDTAVIAEALGS